MPDNTLFSPDFKPLPYWWERSTLVDSRSQTLPEVTDVAIIGAGYTGLHAAIQTARNGLSTVVIDAEAAGFGCSTRNGGQVSTSIKPSFTELSRRHGESLATDILREGQASLDYIERFVGEESIDCDFTVAGRFHGAHTPRHFDRLARECEAGNPAFDTGAYMVTRNDQYRELGTNAYHGGMVLPRHASVDPGRYHAGILNTALNAGVQLVTHCPVEGLQRGTGGFRLTTSRGKVSATRVIVATNGYTGALTPWHRRRVIPIGSYVIATEEIPADIMDRLMPTNRVLSDTRKMVYYYRPSPDRRRILFGGRVSLGETDPRRSAPRLHAEMVRLFPELASTRVSHSWGGLVAYTFDTLMHTGHDEGLYHAMGYCGSGVGMASYLGMRIGRQAAGLDDGATAFDRIGFQTRPLYHGRPWFLAPSIVAYRLRDRLGI
jgi:glycine/D-amino acid oxidase-like deaminating enzyme